MRTRRSMGCSNVISYATATPTARGHEDQQIPLCRSGEPNSYSEYDVHVARVDHAVRMRPPRPRRYPTALTVLC